MVLIFMLLLFYNSVIENKSPIVLISGIGGNKLFVSVHNRTHHEYYCSSNSTEFLLWLNLGEFLVPKCMNEYFKLVYNKINKTYEDNDHVHIRVPDLGPTDSVEHLDEFSTLNYYHSIVQYLVNKHGYIKNVDLKAFTYDFRKVGAKTEFEKFSNTLKQFVEELTLKFYSPVIVISHSMGGVLFNQFQNQMTNEWLNRSIFKWVSLSAPFGGSLDSIRTVITGNDFGIPQFVFNPIHFAGALRTLPSIYYLFPDEGVFNSSIEYLFYKNYSFTINQWKKLMNIAGVEHEDYSFNALKIFIRNPPKIKMLCIFTLGVYTPESFKYSDFNYQPSITYGSGDGTVNEESLKVCLNYEKQAPGRIKSIYFNNTSHLNILHSNKLFEIFDQHLFE